MGLLPGLAADVGSRVWLNSWHPSSGCGIDRAAAVDDATGYSLAQCGFTMAGDEA